MHFHAGIITALLCGTFAAPATRETTPPASISTRGQPCKPNLIMNSNGKQYRFQCETQAYLNGVTIKKTQTTASPAADDVWSCATLCSKTKNCCVAQHQFIEAKGIRFCTTYVDSRGCQAGVFKSFSDTTMDSAVFIGAAA